MGRTTTTQSRAYQEQSSLKNFVRRRVLPSLSEDFDLKTRYSELAAQVAGERVLILGAGDKSEFYQKIFPASHVLTSDIHLQFGVDIVFDAHRIPFDNNFFSLVLAAQVLEHTARPWIVCEEIQRVTKDNGMIQIEVPFCFLNHGYPYDFYRFTLSSLRFLFQRSEIVRLRVPEGAAAAAANLNSQMLVDLFTNRYLRQGSLLLSRLFFWWMKYCDLLRRTPLNQRVIAAKGLVVTYKKDGRVRPDSEMLDDLKSFYEQGQGLSEEAQMSQPERARVGPLAV